MVDYSELKHEIDTNDAIIFALKQSIQYAQNQEEHDTYLEELAFREQAGRELRELIVN